MYLHFLHKQKNRDKKNPLINEFVIQLMIYVLFYTDIFHLLNLHQLSEEDIPLQDYEIKHIEIILKHIDKHIL